MEIKIEMRIVEIVNWERREVGKMCETAKFQ